MQSALYSLFYSMFAVC